MTLSQRLAELVRAAFAGIWIQSFEHDDALAEIATLCRQEQWQLASWDVERGLSIGGKTDAAATDPLAAIRSLSALASTDSAALLVLPNFHRFLSSTEIVQGVVHQLASGKVNRTFICILSPLVQIPIELERQFAIVEHELPTRPQLAEIAGALLAEGERPPPEALEKVLDSSVGLTRHEAENAMALSLVRHGRLDPQVIFEIKAAALKKSGLLTLHQGGEKFDSLGGLDALKSFCTKALCSRSTCARARGILLLGPPGAGKSVFAKALGAEVGRPTLILDVGSLLGGLVGQSEANTRQALKIVMAPAILFCDEIEKALAGAVSSSNGDSGVSARLFGQLLTWLSEHSSDVFFIGTCNDISRLPVEFSRAERFDGIFFLDTPGSAQKQLIWPIYLNRYGIDAKDPRPEDRNWCGAEIAAACRLSALLNEPLKEAARNVVPVAVTAHEQLEKLRNWAAGRCLDANRGGIYTAGADAPKPARRVTRPSVN